MSYLEDAYNYHKDTLANFATYPGGIKGSLPRYYKDKIFDEEEKEIIKNQIDEVINKNANNEQQIHPHPANNHHNRN